MPKSRSPPSNAGKDVYLQKPFTMTHAEGVILRDAVKRHGRILQVGSQQRSWEQFRRAAELIRSGRIGNVQRVEIGLPTDPTAPDARPQPIPANLDFGQWLGPTPFKYYTEMRVHPQADYSRPGWLRHDAHCLGMITGWGSHHYDTMHWALQYENTGPSRVEGKGEFPDPERIWNVHGAYDVTLAYPEQRDVSTCPTSTTPASSSSATKAGSGSRAKAPAPPRAIRRRRARTCRRSTPATRSCSTRRAVASRCRSSKSHHKNWLESVQSRKQPLAPAHVAHRSNTACIVSWIAMKLGRPLEWDPKAERFKNDAEANSMLTRSERAPYGALHLARPDRRHDDHPQWSGRLRGGRVCMCRGYRERAEQGSTVQLITLDPGHFHAALVQKFMLPGVSPGSAGVRARRRRCRAAPEAHRGLQHAHGESDAWVEKVYTGT